MAIMNTSRSSGQEIFPVMRPSLPRPEQFSKRLEDIWNSGIFSNFGPQVQELESRFAKRLNVPADRVVVLSNATAAITGLATISEKAVWRVPSWTFVATPLGVLQAGKSLQFADVDIDSQMLTTSCAYEGGSIATLPFGIGIPQEWLNQSSFPDIIDAAASLASVTDLSCLPSTSSLVFSLHATKYLGAGEGGIAICGNSSIAGELRSWANFGFTAERESQRLGTNAKMSEVQAAIAHAALDSEDEERREWEQLRRKSKAVAEMLAIDIPHLSSQSISPYWMVAFETPLARDVAEKKLKEARIQSRKWWGLGCHLMPSMRALPCESELKNTEALAGTTLGLPFFRGMKDEDFEMIGNVVRASLG